MLLTNISESKPQIMTCEDIISHMMDRASNETREQDLYVCHTNL